MGEYDRTMKLLVDSNPEAMARFVLHQWQKHLRIPLPAVQITRVAELSAEFQSEELDGDNVLLVEGLDGPLYLLEVEFQSTLHSYMPLRSLEYCARAKKKHWKTYGDLPILAAVIYLFNDEGMPEPPLRRVAPGGETVLVFSYLSIQLKTLSREELLALRQPELWPLILLTEGQVDRIMGGKMFAELVDRKLYSTLPLAHTIAAWLMRGDDLAWLHQEYEKMQELFRESPAIQWMEESAMKRVEARITERVTEQVRQEEREKANQRIREERQRAEEERQRVEEERQRAEKERQRVEEERQRAEEERQRVERMAREERQRAMEEHKRILATLRQTVVELVRLRFPELQRLAQAQVSALEQPERFQPLILRLSLARDAGEAQDVLIFMHEKKNEEQEAGQ